MICLHGAIEITDYTPLIMVILFIEEEEEEEEVEEEENGYKKGRQRDLLETPIGETVSLMV